jgi:hypothetical protein
MSAPEISTTLADDDQQRQALLDAQRAANSNTPRNFKEDALTEKVVSVEPDGTGPTPTETLDADDDQRRGSGSGHRDEIAHKPAENCCGR